MYIVHIHIFEMARVLLEANEDCLKQCDAKFFWVLWPWGGLAGPRLVTRTLFLRDRPQNFKVETELPD